MLLLEKNGLSLQVNPEGGRIENMSINGSVVLGTYSRIDGKKGSTHLCVPNFGSEGSIPYGLPFHGPARTSAWTHMTDTPHPDHVLIIRTHLPSTATYRADVQVTQQFELLPNRFVHVVTVEHTGGEAVPANVGIHNYWDTPGGWQGALVNGQDMTEKIKLNGFIPLQKNNTIKFSHRTYMWNVNGFGQAVLWSGFEGHSFDTSYACIEPVMRYSQSPFKDTVFNLSPKRAFVLTQEILV